MYIDIEALFWITLIIFAMYHWWQSQKIKEVALRYTRRQCKELELQLLDDNINLRGFWLKRDTKGQIRIWRSYNFEFSSTGDERYSGRVIILGKAITDFQLDPHRMQ
ncbi:DUF3301 domain-containing protein [Neptuniibacter sp. QD29_5]|uniref:DUF3301 domain-containing protein n=1 Tax=Neptuniibacter sp. QD29_5 TaxID=3398207 RepID=UPI0039F63EAB